MNGTQTAYVLPDWIADQQLLRDEAVLYGLSEAQPDEKLAAIRLAFAALTASTEKKIEQHREVIGDLTAQLESAAQPYTNRQEVDQPLPVGTRSLVRLLVGLFLSTLLSAGTYLGTSSLITSQLALVIATLTGISGCVFTVISSVLAYRASLAHHQLAQLKQANSHQQLDSIRLDWQAQKQAQVQQLYQAEALLAQQQAHRDLLIRLFESEFDLARSMRHQVRARLVDM
ncbi:hypothetical protein [Fibrella arboris]|uniref:hypothetical protein n=1 Tax=Fibrella arboris TaxID=3242486 RepID=UPI0035211B29